MSSNRSRAQARITVGESDTVVVDIEETLDEIYSALANKHRRHVLSVMRREPTSIDVRELARQVTIQEACDNSKMVTEASIGDVHVSLYDNHLPKLADLGIIEYDTGAEVVEEITGAIQ